MVSCYKFYINKNKNISLCLRCVYQHKQVETSIIYSLSTVNMSQPVSEYIGSLSTENMPQRVYVSDAYIIVLQSIVTLSQPVSETYIVVSLTTENLSQSIQADKHI